MFLTGGGNNETGWSNARYDELIALAAEEANQEKRYQYFQEAESILVEGVPILPIYTYVSKHLIHPSLDGWYGNIMDWHPYKYLSLKEPE